MSVIKYSKLVRDYVPEIIEASGKTCVTEILSDDEYLRMIDKFFEYIKKCKIDRYTSRALLIATNLPLAEIVEHAGTIITVFSLIATLPLSFLALLIDKILKGTKEEEVSKETFVSITLDILYSMIVIGIIIVAAYCEIPAFVQKIIVGIIAFLVIKIALNILMILKRVFAIWEK